MLRPKSNMPLVPRSAGPGLLKGLGLAVKAVRENSLALSNAVGMYSADATLDQVLRAFTGDTTAPLDDRVQCLVFAALGDIRDNAYLAAQLMERLSTSMNAIGRLVDDLGHRPLRAVVEDIGDDEESPDGG